MEGEAMTNQTSPTPVGWYPAPDRPMSERYGMDRTGPTSTARRRHLHLQQASFRRHRKTGMSTAAKVLLGLGGFFVLGLGGCIAIIVAASP